MIGIDGTNGVSYMTIVALLVAELFFVALRDDLRLTNARATKTEHALIQYRRYCTQAINRSNQRTTALYLACQLSIVPSVVVTQAARLTPLH